MDKSSEAFRTIGEMAKELGVKTHILRYWEEQFPMLNPLKRAGGRRHYRPDDVKLLNNISNLLNNEGYTIKGARKYLAGGRAKTATAVASNAPALPLAADDASTAALVAIRDRLTSALEQA